MCRCLMCNLVGFFRRPHAPLREVLRTMEEAALVGVEVLDIFGGEVTLRRDLFELVRHARWLGLQCMFITTGYYLTPAYVRRLERAGVNRIVVSIDGSRPEIHDAIRQLPGMHVRAVRALKALAAAGGIETFASTVILEQNLHDLPDLVRLSGRLGIRGHEFFLPISGPVASTVPRWPTRPQAVELFARIVPAVEREARRWGVSVDFRPEFRVWPVPRAAAAALVSSGCYNTHHPDPRSRCRAAGWNLFVTVTGDVYPCDMPSLIRKGGALGNLRDASLLDIVTSTAMADFDREAGHRPGCRMCVGRYEAVRPPPPPGNDGQTATRGRVPR
jgi:radical SAM protein with 4Fe4S-binding SPASM domain